MKPITKQRAIVSVCGVVQGVGFRPYVYRLATQHHLNGWVRNTSGKVEIEVEGDKAEIHSFLQELELQAPPLAHIEDIQTTISHPRGYTDFRIHESLPQRNKYQLVSPDIATCADCRDEIFNPNDRRFRYPFTNCTNCGPRFTIIKDIPYDRPKTTMREFKMCPICEKEYLDPLNRRFHAQPNACPVCGPELELVDAAGKAVKCVDVIIEVGELLKKGKILAIRGLGGFQLACDATNQTAVNLLRTENTACKPFAVMVSTIADVKKHCHVSVEEIKLLESPQAPIVFLRHNKKPPISLRR